MARDVEVQVLTKEVEETAGQLLSKTADASKAFEAVGRILVNRIRLCFRESRSPWGVSWLPIKFRAPKVAQRRRVVDGQQTFQPRRDTEGNLVLTARGRAQQQANVAAAAGKGFAGKPLIDTGRLRSSITYQADKDGVDVGTSLRQAKLQHFGGKILPKNAQLLAFPGPGGGIVFSKGTVIPARPFMPINPQGQLALPPSWSKGILGELAKHLELGVPA